MTRILINIGLFIFFVFSILIVAIYFGLLYDKITRPDFKNMDTEGFMWFALLVIPLMIADFFILRRFVRTLKQ
jgi:hypothetical protein